VSTAAEHTTKLNWFVYIIEASNKALYTGITTDIDRRFQEHLSGKKGAKFFNGRPPVKVVFQEPGHTRQTASRREYQIKKMTRQQKLTLISKHH
jgi:putative endonuclease